MRRSRAALVPAALALSGAALVGAGVVGGGLHYAGQPDAAVGTPPGSSALDRAVAGLISDSEDLAAHATGGTSEPRTVSAPMPERTYGPSDPDTYDGGMDLPAAAEQIAGTADVLLAPSAGIRVSYALSPAENGALVLPPAPGTVLYDQTTAPGQDGTTLIAGHVNYDDLSLSPFSQIAGLDKGAPVLVTDDAGDVHEYVVDSLSVYEQQALPDELFTTAGPDRLVLVTCSGESISTGGAWAYQYNLVVTAHKI